MNNLEALIIVRGAARMSAQMRTRQGIAAGKVVDRKIQSLMRKKAWRDGGGATPVHMGDAEFRYLIPDDPFTAALKKIAAIPTDPAAPNQSTAVAIAQDVLSSMERFETEPGENASTANPIDSR